MFGVLGEGDWAIAFPLIEFMDPVYLEFIRRHCHEAILCVVSTEAMDCVFWLDDE